MTVRRARGALPMLVVLAVLVSLLGGFPRRRSHRCSRGTVALTFDDGPHSSHTPNVLDMMRERGARGVRTGGSGNTPVKPSAHSTGFGTEPTTEVEDG